MILTFTSTLNYIELTFVNYMLSVVPFLFVLLKSFYIDSI